jgi:O-antigen ligase
MTVEALPGGRQAQSAAASDLLSLAAIGLMLACLLLGGATRQNALLVAILELMALPIAMVAGWRLATAHGLRTLAAPLVILLAIVLLPLAQLIPLPFETWAQLPGRADLAAGLRQAGAAPAWLPMSVTPDLTLRSAFALIPPIAVFLAGVQMSGGARRRVVEMVLLVVLVSIVLGLLQVATGRESVLRPYPTTNATSAVGFFANRNHQAALMLASIPLAAAWAVERGDKPIRWLAVGLAVLAVAGIGVARSRAGILLIAPALLGAMLVILRGAARKPERRRLGFAFGAVALAGVALTGALWGGDIAQRFEDRAENEMRLNVLPAVLELAETYAPYGSGIGSFDPAYRVIEPVEAVGTHFLNHAHNDYAEVWVEAGVAGAVVVIGFLVWAAIAGFRIWSAPARGGAINRAATVVILLLVIHSLVDYPLRTLALAGLFAFACALIAAPTPLARPIPPRR